MGIFAWLAGATPEPDTADSALDSVLWNLDPRIQYSTLLSLGVAAVFRARQLNADTVAGLPLVMDNGQAPPAPNLDQTWQQFTVETILSLQDSGDAYWRVASNGSIRVLPHTEMSVTWNAQMTQRVYRYNLGGVIRHWGINPPLVVLSMNRGAHDATGFGPMESKRIRGLIAETDYAQQYFENSGAPSGTLTVPGEMTKPEADKLREQWIAARNVRAPAVLGGGAVWESTSFSPTDSEWVAGHLAGVGDAATLFGVPGALLQYSQPGSSLTYENIQDVYQGYWRATLRPTYAVRIEEALAPILNTRVTFNPESLFLASISSRAQAAATLTNAGYNPEESARVVGLPPITHSGLIPTTVQTEE